MKKKGLPSKAPAAFFALLLILSLFSLVSCGGGTDGGTPGGDPEREARIGAVPEDVRFEGKAFTMLCCDDQCASELSADGDPADQIDAAIMRRDSAVEEALDVELNTVALSANGGASAEELRNAVLAGEGRFDAIAGPQNVMSSVELAGLFANVCETPYVSGDLKSSYFCKDLSSNLTVNGRLYYLAGDYTLSLLGGANVLFFNKRICEEQKLEDPYQLVRDNEWTSDKLIEMSRGLYADLNGDGVKDAGDKFAYVTDFGETVNALTAQFDVPLTSKSENEDIVISVDRGKVVSVLEKMIGFFDSNEVFAYRTFGLIDPEQKPFFETFASGRALFYPDKLSVSGTLRNRNADVGILPYPKWTDSQTGYYTSSQTGYTVVAFPVDAPDKTLSGAVVDALFAASCDHVTPAFCDSFLTGRAQRDAESGEMLDIIRSGLRMDFGIFHRIGMDDVISDLLAERNVNFVSYYSVRAREYQNALKNVLEKVYGIK